VNANAINWVVRSDLNLDGRINNTDIGGFYTYRGNDARFISDPVFPVKPMSINQLDVTVEMEQRNGDFFNNCLHLNQSNLGMSVGIAPMVISSSSPAYSLYCMSSNNGNRINGSLLDNFESETIVTFK
jgi:hypothetical protein